MKKNNSISLIKKYGLAFCFLFSSAKAYIVSKDDPSDNLSVQASSDKIVIDVPFLGKKETISYQCVYRRGHLVGAVNPLLITFGLGSHDYVSSDLTGGYFNPSTVFFGASKLYERFQERNSRFPSYKTEATYLFYGYAAYKVLNTYQQLEAQDEATLTKIFLSTLSGFPYVNITAEALVRGTRGLYLTLPSRGFSAKSLPVSPKLMDRFEANLGAISTPDISCP
jgi:hypothetical protein